MIRNIHPEGTCFSLHKLTQIIHTHIYTYHILSPRSPLTHSAQVRLVELRDREPRLACGADASGQEGAREQGAGEWSGGMTLTAWPGSTHAHTAKIAALTYPSP